MEISSFEGIACRSFIGEMLGNLAYFQTLSQVVLEYFLLGKICPTKKKCLKALEQIT